MRRVVQLLMALYYPFLAAVCAVAGALAWFFISLGLDLGGRLGLLIMAPLSWIITGRKPGNSSGIGMRSNNG